MAATGMLPQYWNNRGRFRLTSNALERLHDYITDVIYPSYKMAPNRRGAVYRLDLANLKMLSNFDAEWFLRAVEGNLFTEIHGEFTMARNSARESIFWSGLKSEVPQSKGIAVEPIVTMGAIARLHFEHGWPLDCLGTQPTKWKFDLAAYNTDGEAILCEVKRRPRDVERMCAFLRVRSSRKVWAN